MDTVKFVGGPKDGEDYTWTTSSEVLVPDAKDVLHVVYDDGDTGTLFGWHTYEMKCYATGPLLKHWQLEYVGYKPPVLRDGMRQIGDGRAVFHE